MSLTINGVEVATMRWTAPWSGVWTAEIELHDGALVTPSGRVAIASTEGIALVGTVDTTRSGSFGERRFVRVVGGGGGWSKKTRPQHYHSSVGLLLQVVASTTAAEVGEVVTVLEPKTVGLDFVRRAAPASQIFTDAGVDWWVGLDGITRVGVRPPVTPPTGLEILDWDPRAGTVSFTCPVLIEPGTVIVDDRFGSKTVRTVEAMVSGGSVTGTLWLADSAASVGAVDELVDSLAALAREATGAAASRLYEYQVLTMRGDRVDLRAVKPSDGVPDLLPASVWAGISGYKAELRPGSKVLVGFIGDQRRPFVAFYEPPKGDGWRPLKLELDATSSIEIGAQAINILLGGAGPTSKPVVRMTESLASWITAVTTVVNSIAPGSATPPTDIASTKVLAT